jgi:RNA polymerase sigma-70 factor (ECF subfamily)
VPQLRSDEEIVAGLLKGESWAAEQLYERVHPHVGAALRRLLRSRGPDYEDLMQASFERILKVLSERSLKSPYNLPGWASAVAVHVGLDALRRRGREQRLFDAAASPEPSTEDSPERAVASRVELERVQRLLSEMKPAYATTVVLHDVLGHPLAVVAEMTSVHVAAAQSRLVRGRKELLRRARITVRGPRSRARNESIEDIKLPAGPIRKDRG